jgi:organic radical activating enzyme
MKLRLLLFKKCLRNCSRCCNKDWDLDSLLVVKSFKGYSEVLLTGGEPMLDPDLIIETIKRIKTETNAKIYLYTAKVDDISKSIEILKMIDGFCVTLHDRSDIVPFVVFNENIIMNNLQYNKSLPLNIFAGINEVFFDTEFWKVKSDMVWIKNCPLPDDEIFMRL